MALLLFLMFAWTICGANFGFCIVHTPWCSCEIIVTNHSISNVSTEPHNENFQWPNVDASGGTGGCRYVIPRCCQQWQSWRKSVTTTTWAANNDKFHTLALLDCPRCSLMILSSMVHKKPVMRGLLYFVFDVKKSVYQWFYTLWPLYEQY